MMQKSLPNKIHVARKKKKENAPSIVPTSTSYPIAENYLEMIE